MKKTRSSDWKPSGVRVIGVQLYINSFYKNIHSFQVLPSTPFCSTLLLQLLVKMLKDKVPPRLELGSLDSESRVLTITPWDLRGSQMREI